MLLLMLLLINIVIVPGYGLYLMHIVKHLITWLTIQHMRLDYTSLQTLKVLTQPTVKCKSLIP